jgi:DNA/RNA-binding domain of Phe-tRNA-synthetase-like protein
MTVSVTITNSGKTAGKVVIIFLLQKSRLTNQRRVKGFWENQFVAAW